MRILILLSLFIGGCSLSQKKDKFYKVSMEITRDNKVQASPTVFVNGNEGATVFIHDDKKDQFLEVQIEEVKNGSYMMNASYCDDVSSLNEIELEDLSSCSKSGKMKIMGKLNGNALVSVDKEGYKKTFKFNVSEVDQEELLNEF